MSTSDRTDVMLSNATTRGACTKPRRGSWPSMDAGLDALFALFEGAPGLAELEFYQRLSNTGRGLRLTAFNDGGQALMMGGQRAEL